jgi:hypothetical protein
LRFQTGDTRSIASCQSDLGNDAHKDRGMWARQQLQFCYALNAYRQLFGVI